MVCPLFTLYIYQIVSLVILASIQFLVVCFQLQVFLIC